jgi:hypothetical protein
MASDSRTELLLAAVRYYLDEMPDAERQAFEGLLDRDQRAREALAEAVELAQAIASFPPTAVGVRPAGRRGTRAAVRLLAAAAVLLAIGLGLWVQKGGDRGRQGADVAVARQAEPAVALAWSGLRQTGAVDIVSHSDLVAWLEEAPAASEAEAIPGETLGPDDSALPPWLLAAASLPPTAPVGTEVPREN